MSYKSFYHDMRDDTIITEHEYNIITETESANAPYIAYFGLYENRREAQNDLDTIFSYLKQNPAFYGTASHYATYSRKAARKKVDKALEVW